MTRLTGLAVLVFGLAFPVLAGQLRAAVVKVDITPATSQWLVGYEPRQSTGVHDPLFHRILVMNDGKTSMVLVSTDLGVISPSFYDEYCKELEKETGIPKKQFWWSVTHTHAGPEVGPPGLAKSFLKNRYNHDWDAEYTARVTRSLTDGIKKALAHLEPARMGTGQGMSRANINRRARDVDGKIYLGLNPDAPVDRTIGLIRLERPDGSLIALIANYAMHGTVLGAVKEISGDFPGIVADYVEKKLGAPMLYINGAAGNIGPIYYFNPRPANLTKFNVLLGDRILAANSSIRADEGVDPVFQAEEQIVETPQKPGIEWPSDMEQHRRINSAGTTVVRLPVRYLKLRSDTVLWAAPLELFSEIAIRVRNESPFPNTYYFGYTNGWFGYLPTEAAFSEGGYETNVSPFTTQAEKDLGDAVITHLHGMSRK